MIVGSNSHRNAHTIPKMRRRLDDIHPHHDGSNGVLWARGVGGGFKRTEFAMANA